MAILDTLNEGINGRIKFDDLVMRMVASIWFPIEYYKISFGKQDGFKNVTNYISSRMTVDTLPLAPLLENQINQKLSEIEIRAITSKVNELLRWVPYRFLRPFFMSELRGLEDWKVNNSIMALCNELFEQESRRVMYKFEGRYIILNDSWLDYLKTHQQILRGFTYWYLIKFLQKNNPNVPGLSNKIFKPDANDRDLTNATKFWKGF